jgi:hypothetical protein
VLKGIIVIVKDFSFVQNGVTVVFKPNINIYSSHVIEVSAASSVFEYLFRFE